MMSKYKVTSLTNSHTNSKFPIVIKKQITENHVGACFIFHTYERAHGSPSSAWSAWWRYEGISGPEYWGKINPDWTLCEKGKQQSPVDIDPRSLVYDPNLRPFKMEKKRIDAMLMNTGRDVTMAIREDPSNYITILTGPFSYRFRIYQLKIHFGTVDNAGSEHTIGGQSFAAEIHLIAYNTDLYDNYTSALASPHGIVAIAIFAMLSEKTGNEFDVIGKEFENIRFKGEKRNISQVLLADIIPKTDHYMTYEGSLTQPGCQETVTWIILNKPIYVTKIQRKQVNNTTQSKVQKNTPLIL
ncbi:putative carbonic anhydrase-like protein 1 isoform X3 [Octopus bimaculoides]|uniref:putative carbonic anhydrase-like protein 1 isoform X3 n=1 Tax=Octopus bimaculoides TaxID=37653 RepID=UPI0022E093F9|nr:putative carbonic anhydrase-like protein 1 isoform X3 [Octopus bimaculoides]